MIQFIAHILGYDLWFYASHILLHMRLLYPLHSIHHQKVVPTLLDTYHGHWIEGPLQSLGFLVPFFWWPVSTWSSAAALVFVNVRGMFRHDQRTSWIDGGHHLIHHKCSRYNYGEPWLDTLFGTKMPDMYRYYGPASETTES